MVLDQQAKGELEKYVDKVTSSPGGDYWYLLMCRMSHEQHEEIKNVLHYKNTGDFWKGTMYGAIVWGYAERFYALFQRDLTYEEIAEMREVLVNKMRERDMFLRTD